MEIGLAKPNGEMWDNLLKVFRMMLEKSEQVYLAKAKSTFQSCCHGMFSGANRAA